MLFGNKDSFAFEVLPVSPSWDLRADSERAAWAGFAVWVEGRNVCKHSSRATGATDELIYMPLGPIADWLVRSWHAIAFEEKPPGFVDEGDARRTFARWATAAPPKGVEEDDWYETRRLWWSRHFIEAGNCGCVIPDIALVRDGPWLRVSWSAVSAIDFDYDISGSSVVAWDSARDAIGEFVKVVASAFRESKAYEVYPWVGLEDPIGVEEDSGPFSLTTLALFTGYPLEELRRYTGTENDDGLRARLGLKSREAAPDESIITQILRDTPTGFGDAIYVVASDIDRACRQEPLDVPLLHRLRSYMVPQTIAEKAGNDAATLVRAELSLDGAPVEDTALTSLTAELGVEVETASPPGVAPWSRRVDLVVGAARDSSRCAARVFRSQARWVRRFQSARIVGIRVLSEYRGGVMGHAISPNASPWIRRASGAFAAELLLPESGVRAMGLASLDAATDSKAFSALMGRYGIGARAAAYRLWNLRFLSSATVRDQLIAEFGEQVDT
jgi:hypothetical protein